MSNYLIWTAQLNLKNGIYEELVYKGLAGALHTIKLCIVLQNHNMTYIKSEKLVMPWWYSKHNACWENVARGVYSNVLLDLFITNVYPYIRLPPNPNYRNMLIGVLYKIQTNCFLSLIFVFRSCMDGVK